ncbi:hypothetical protein [Pseudomonas sp.]|uniref:hypothetical protein n=1 Tax=Pseudomonas sp. TaxID=306 RepID=UPI003A970740
MPKSVTAKQLYDDLFDNMPPAAMAKFSALNPGLGGMIKAASIVVLSDPKNTSCTYSEAQLMQVAETVNKALEPLSPTDADFMYRHRHEIASFSGETSTWLGVSASVMQSHLDRMTSTLKAMETLHQETYRKTGGLKSAEFFAERKRLISQLDSHLLNSTKVRAQTTLGDHPKLKSALGISSRSLVHQWDKAGAPGQIPGYATHIEPIARYARFMKYGGYLAIGAGAISSTLAVKEVCSGVESSECKKVKVVEGSKFAGSVIVAGAAGGIASAGAATACAALSFTGVGGVVCAAVLIGAGSFIGTGVGSGAGEYLGEHIYEMAPE